MTDGQLNTIREKYFNKIFNAGAWKRLLTFRTDFRLLFKSLMVPIKAKLKKPAGKAAPGRPEEIVPGKIDLNPHLAAAYRNFISRHSILLLFGEKDRLYWDFEEKFLRYYAQANEAYQHNVTMAVIPKANHIFSFSEVAARYAR